MGVLELVGHVLDALEALPRRLGRGVLGEHQVGQAFEHLRDRVREVLQVLALDGQRLRAKRLFAVAQVLETVGLDLNDFLEVFLRERDVVVGVVVRRVGVLVGARFLKDIGVHIGRVFFRTPEHHVLEEMREAGLARFDFIARTGLDRDLDRDDVGEVRRYDDDAQAVLQVANEVRHVEDLGGFLSRLGLRGVRGRAAGDEEGCGRQGGNQLVHLSSMGFTAPGRVILI